MAYRFRCRGQAALGSYPEPAHAAAQSPQLSDPVRLRDRGAGRMESKARILVSSRIRCLPAFGGATVQHHTILYDAGFGTRERQANPLTDTTEVHVSGVVTSVTGQGPACEVHIRIDQGSLEGAMVRLRPSEHHGPEPAVFELGDRWEGTLLVPANHG